MKVVVGLVRETGTSCQVSVEGRHLEVADVATAIVMHFLTIPKLVPAGFVMGYLLYDSPTGVSHLHVFCKYPLTDSVLASVRATLDGISVDPVAVLKVHKVPSDLRELFVTGCNWAKVIALWSDEKVTFVIIRSDDPNYPVGNLLSGC